MSHGLATQEGAAGRNGWVRLRAWLPWLLGTLSLGQVVFALVLAGLNHLTPARFLAEYVVAQCAAALGFASVGLLIATRRPAHRLGWLFCVAGVGSGFTTWIQQYVRYTVVTRPGALFTNALLVWVYVWSWLPVVALVVFCLPLLFPDGRLPSPRWRPAVWLMVAATTLLTVDAAVSPGPMDDSLPEVSNPFGLTGLVPLLEALQWLIIPLTLACLVLAAAAPIVRFRRAQGAERQQLKWFALGVAGLVVAFAAPAILAYPTYSNTLLSGTLLAVAQPALAAATGVAILRYRLYDIDLILRRTLVYGALTLCVVGLYILVVAYLGSLFQAQGNLLISLVATGLVAVLFQPLRDWLQRGVGRMLYGERDDPYRVLARLGQRLDAALDPDAVLPTLVLTVKEALRLPYAAVHLRREDGFDVASEVGQAVGDPLALPLTYQGEVVGRLLVSPRAAGEDWSPADRRLLADLAHQAGAAVHGVQVMTELQRARERLVLAREEERRRLRRDLHDDLAPSLAALALTAATVGELIPSNPTAAGRAVDKLQTAIRTTVGQVRSLVYDLRPPTLDELGLVEAIREQADRLQSAPAEGGGLTITVTVADDLPPLPAAVEVAIYRLAQEALMNVVRHAKARTCHVRLDCPVPGRVQVAVTDDGVGLPPGYRAGVGLRSMRERAAELGGVCEVQRGPSGGVAVVAWFPLSRESGTGQGGSAWNRSVS